MYNVTYGLFDTETGIIPTASKIFGDTLQF